MRPSCTLSLETMSFYWDMETNTYCDLLTKKRKKGKLRTTSQSTNFILVIFSSYFYLSKIICPVQNVNVNTFYSLSFIMKFKFPDQNSIQTQSKCSTTLKWSHSAPLGALMHVFCVLGDRVLQPSEISFVLYVPCL